MKSYTPTIGIEVHAELKTKTKMFCSSKNEPHTKIPNTHVCPICMGHPGTLPVVNETAVTCVVAVGKAINGTIATYTEFDRKNYFYPDIPKGYQISQYKYPIVSGGELDGVAITRVHLEEDTARSLHTDNESSVDYNRAGVPLMELVTEPVLHSGEEAAHFARELQLLLRTLNVSDANMEKGEMRVEANISVSSTNSLGTKVEIKNLNSFKAVEAAIVYEIKRQTDLLEKDEKVVQETRGWDEIKGKTFSQRVKETAHDYRYFPEPDVVKYDFSSIKNNIVLPILPINKRKKYANIGLSSKQIEMIIFHRDIDDFFSSILESGDVSNEYMQIAANYICTDLIAFFEGNIAKFAVANAYNFQSLISLVLSQKITSRVAKDLLNEFILVENADFEEIISKRGLSRSSDQGEITVLARNIIAENALVVEEVRAGKESALQFLVGKGMQVTKGSVDPKILLAYLKEEISK